MAVALAPPPLVSMDARRLALACVSIVAATLPPSGGQPEVQRIETTRVAIRRFIERLGGPGGSGGLL